MGSIGQRRMTSSAPFEYLQSDLKGPLFISEHVNKRSTRKVWLMTNICHFSRFISISVVEDLSTEALLNTFMGHVFRYGNTKIIESDCGSNYQKAQRVFQENNDDEEDLANVKWPEIKSKLKSRGIQLVIRGAKMPWIMGGAESTN